VLRALAGSGLEPLLALEPQVRVTKRGFALTYTREGLPRASTGA
jgi:hypothetical protein